MQRLLVASGSAAVVGSGLLPWLRFERSELSGFRLAELVASVADEYHVGPPSWLGIAWYALPITGLLAWFVLLLSHPVRVRVRTHLILGLMMAVISVTFAVAAHRTVGLQSGEIVAVGGALAVVAGALLERKLKVPPGTCRPY